MKSNMVLPLAVALTAALGGCGFNQANPPGFVAKQWFAQIRELQVNVVFPPREDVQVGDIYITPSASKTASIIKSEDYLPISLLGAHADLNEALDTYYADRSSYPLSTASTVPTDAQDPDITMLPQANLKCPSNTTDCNIFTSPAARDLRRLRLVAFPDFLSTTINTGDLSALIPVEAFTGQLGGMFSRSESVTLKIPVAESLSLPLLDALGPLKNASVKLCEKLDGHVPMSVNDEEKPPSSQGAADWATTADLTMIAINEVFYTRAIDISVGIDTQNVFGMEMDVLDPRIFKQPEPGTTLPSMPAPTTTSTTSSSGTPQTNMQTPAMQQPGNQDLLSQIDTANAKLGEIMARSTPGAGLQITSVSSGQVGMRRTFSRPIAIGYRGIWLQLHYNPKTKTCSVANLGSAGGNGDVLPTTPPTPAPKPTTPVTPSPNT